jgi:tRNA(adenine34) deaminase
MCGGGTAVFVRLLSTMTLLSVASFRYSFCRPNRVVFNNGESEQEINSYFMKLALHQASLAEAKGEVPIGALLVQELDGNTYRILSKAGNRVEQQHDASAHAELQVLRRGSRRLRNWRLLNTTLYSTLEPCPMCLSACQAFRLPRLVYGAPDLRLGAVETHMRLLDTTHPFHNVSTVIKHVRAQESADMLRDFFRKRRLEESRNRQVYKFWDCRRRK